MLCGLFSGLACAGDSSPLRQEPASAGESRGGQTSPIEAPEPATASALRKVLDLEQLPRLKESMLLDRGPTSIFYQATATVEEVAAFYRKELESRGWKVFAGSPPANPAGAQDLLFQRDGFILRADLAGSGSGETSVSLTSLGNLDMRSLPRMPDAALNPEAGFTQAGHASPLPVAETADALAARMTESGWQRCGDPTTPAMDVPNYRSLDFRKNGIRVTLGVSQNPQQPDGPTMVFYLAAPALPFDVPLESASTPLELQLSTGRASWQTSLSRAGLRELVEREAPRLGWKLPESAELDRFVNGETPWIQVPCDAASLLAIGLTEQAGKYSVTIQRMASPSKPAPGSVP